MPVMPTRYASCSTDKPAITSPFDHWAQYNGSTVTIEPPV